MKELAFFILTITIGCHALDASTTKPFVMNAQVYGNGHFLAGTPAIVRVHIKNASDQSQVLPASEGGWYFSGKSCFVPLNIETAPPRLPGDETPHSEPPKAPPGWEKDWEYDLAQWCSFKEGGQYQLEYRFLDWTSGYEPADPVKVNISIDEPTGLNKLAHDALQSCEEQLKFPRDTIGKCYKELLRNYPDSIYTAWPIYNTFENPTRFQPAEIKEAVSENLFPTSNVVPDAVSEDGWRYDIGEGKPMAEWQVQWAEKILKDHPSFPMADRVELNLGINYLVLGKTDAAIGWLNKVATKQDTKEGIWAKNFLEIWQQNP